MSNTQEMKEHSITYRGPGELIAMFDIGEYFTEEKERIFVVLVYIEVEKWAVSLYGDRELNLSGHIRYFNDMRDARWAFYALADKEVTK